MGRESKYYAYQQASLSQKVSFNIPLLREVVGSDEKIGDSIAILTYIDDPKNTKLLNEKPLKWMIGLLNVLRFSHFANSEKTDILSKLGLLFPKKDEDEDWEEDESG